MSEVVTNSVLHAGTEIRLRCRVINGGVRVEVFDRSPLRPAVRHYEADATTGRGLGLVSALAASWGITNEEDGKTLWFEVGDATDGGSPAPDVAPEPEPPATAPLAVELPGASPVLIRATVEHGDALLRELALLALGGELEEAGIEGLPVQHLDVSPILEAAEEATRRGAHTVDLQLRLPPGSDVAAGERLRLVDQADRLAREGRLLSAPALPEIAVCRHWIFNQIMEQAAGFAPQRWELPERLEPARVAARLPGEQLQRLRHATSAVIVADDANRIIFVNDSAAELLGWVPEALTGQRLTVLMPPEFREAHLAGFTRLQVTGEARILGSTLRVPALRRDGSTVEVDLTIHQFVNVGERQTFCGELVPAAG